MSAGQDASVSAVSGPDTGVLRIEHVGTHDFDLGALAVKGRSAEQARADALPAGREQREPHPPLEIDGRGRGGDVTETRLRRLPCDEVHPVAQAPRAIDRAHADEL